MQFLARIIINALAILVTAYIIPGIHVTDDIIPLLFVGLIITLVNAFIRPILTFLSCPFVLLTLGLFILVINGLVLQIAASLTSSLTIDGFFAAFLGGIVMAIINMVLEGLFGMREEASAKRD